jgi:hypothetical protein
MLIRFHKPIEAIFVFLQIRKKKLLFEQFILLTSFIHQIKQYEKVTTIIYACGIVFTVCIECADSDCV